MDGEQFCTFLCLQLFDFLELPPSRKTDINYYSPIQLENLIETFEGDPLRNIVYITTLYGLRRSEVLGLRWDSINFDNDTLEIKYTVSAVKEVVAYLRGMSPIWRDLVNGKKEFIIK